MADDGNVSQWWIEEHWRQYEEHQKSERERYGEEEYARRQKAKSDTVTELRTRADLMANDARSRGFVFFACDLFLASRSMPLLLRFGDGNGAFYERSMGIIRVAQKNKLRPTLSEITDMKIAVRIYIKNLEGIRTMGRGMVRERVRANIKR